MISTQGTWCLSHDIATGIATGDAIQVATNNVTIDCNNFKLGGLSAGLGTQANGIHSNNMLNTSVRNCNVRGFFRGIFLEGASGGGHQVIDNKLDGNTRVGIYVAGDGSTVERNRVVDSGASTTQVTAFGISTLMSVDVRDNTVNGVAARVGGNGPAYGIQTSVNQDGQVANNRVRGVVKDGTGVAIGIHNLDSGYVTLRGNDVMGSGDPTSIGISCTTTSAAAVGNIIGHFNDAIVGCDDSIGNVVRP